MVALVWLPAVVLSAAEGSATSQFHSYTVLDGMTQSFVLDVEQDQAGYLWFTTDRGLNRFDGKEFEHFTIKDGLPNNRLTAIRVTSSNEVWVGDQKGGISTVQGARVVSSTKPLAGANNPVLDIEFVGSSILAVVEDFGIVKLIKSGDVYVATHMVGDETLGITNIEIFGETVWIESSTGLYRLNRENAPVLELLDESIRKIHVDAKGILWAGDELGTIGTWVDGTFQRQVSIQAGSELVAIVTDDKGLVWAAFTDELFSFRRSDIDGSTAQDRPRRYDDVDNITSLFVDRENSLWISTESRLVRFLGDRFRHFRLRTTLNHVTVWGIGEDRLGRLWFGSQSNLLVRQTDETITTVSEDFGLPTGAVRDVVSDGADTVWVGVMEHGLYAVDVDTLLATHIIGTDGIEILDIDIASDGGIWFSTIGSGVFRYDSPSRTLRNFPAPNATSVYTLDTWPDGSVWYGADEVGLVRLQPGGAGEYSQTLISDQGNVSRRLFDHIRLTGPNSAWIATEEGGVFYYDGGGFTQYGTDSPLSDQTVYVIEPLENGTVVVGGEQGLYQFFPEQDRFVHYNFEVGFIGLETNVHASFLDSKGYLWLGTVDGATQMDVEKDMRVPYPSIPMIVRVESELDGSALLDNQEIEAGEFGARIEFAAVSLLAPRGMQYSYKLMGEDSAWGSPTTSRSVSYPRLPPGSYEFVVRARAAGGDWSEQYGSYVFTVLPYFWQRPWIVPLVALIVLIVIRIAIGYRTRKIQWMNDTLRAQVKERTQSIELAHTNLEKTNERLSEEMGARSELETRFRQAFENAPIGMGLLDANGVLFDANLALENMFWPDEGESSGVQFRDTVCLDDKECFDEIYETLVTTDRDDMNEKISCIGPHGSVLETLMHLSVVRNDVGDFLYTVLQIQDVTESLKLTSQLEYQASYDELTELLNRRAFEAELEKAWSNSAKGKPKSYLMFMDLDQFKVVNDTSGHTAGDQLLRAVSEILTDSVRSYDIVGRLGGDEFGIILLECPAHVAKRIAENIRSRIESFRFRWDTETYRIGVSVGGIPIAGDIGDVNELQQLADAACYAAKEAGRNRVHMVEGDADSARTHRGQVRWVQRIREAMDNNRFAIYAQPIRAIVENPGEPERLEILLRLRDPETRRLIPPGAFLPAAERYGLSVELDKWVVKSLLDTLFIHSAFQAEQRSYWINLSGSSIGDKRFASFLKDAIARSPLPPGTVNFEITETAVIRSLSEAGELMGELREMGCQFALDDFGSGLSSFGYLKKLPVDYIKIDGMFVRDIESDRTNRVFVKSIIDIAKTLDIKTVVEFVESDEILKIVTELGAEFAQGFAIGRPFELAPRFPKVAVADLADIKSKAG